MCLRNGDSLGYVRMPYGLIHTCGTAFNMLRSWDGNGVLLHFRKVGILSLTLSSFLWTKYADTESVHEFQTILDSMALQRDIDALHKWCKFKMSRFET